MRIPRRRPDGGPPLSFTEIEGGSRDLRTLAGVEGEERPVPTEMLTELEHKGLVQVVHRAPPCTVGWSHGGLIYVDPSKDGDALEDVVIHEIVHWYLDLWGLAPRDHHTHVDDLIVCTLAPADAVLRLLDKYKGLPFAVQALVNAYGHTTPDGTRLLVRAAHLCQVALVVYDERARRVQAPSPIYEVNLRLPRSDERRLVDAAFEQGLAWDEHHGVLACPFTHRGVDYAVVVLVGGVSSRIRGGVFQDG